MNNCEPANGIHVIPRGSEICYCGQSSRTVHDARAFLAWKNLGSPSSGGALASNVPRLETPAAVELVPGAAADVDGVTLTASDAGSAPAPVTPEAPAADAAPADIAASAAPKEGRRRREK